MTTYNFLSPNSEFLQNIYVNHMHGQCAWYLHSINESRCQTYSLILTIHIQLFIFEYFCFSRKHLHLFLSFYKSAINRHLMTLAAEMNRMMNSWIVGRSFKTPHFYAKSATNKKHCNEQKSINAFTVVCISVLKTTELNWLRKQTKNPNSIHSIQ